MPGNYSHTTRATGSTLTATIYNGDHQNHITNATPDGQDDYSVNVSQMQSVVDPYPGAVESLATSTAGEFERMRFLLKQITGKSQWYIDPDTNLSSVGAGTNLLINGGFNIAQRGTSFTSTTAPLNSDDTYLLDRWALLSDGNDVVDVTQQSGGGVSGTEDYIRLDVETISKKFGIIQFVENKNLREVIGGSDVVSLSFEAKVTNITKLSDIRAAVLAWDSTADTVTSDIVSTWNAEGTRPTYVANWTAENTDSDLTVTASWARYTIENISIDTASTTNIAVFIYQNNVATSDTAGIFLEITNVQLVPSATASVFEYRDIATELAMCKRYVEVLNNAGTANYTFGEGQVITTTAAFFPIFFEVEKRAIPSLSRSAAGDFLVTEADGAGEDVTVFTFAQISKSSCLLDITVAANLIAGNSSRVQDDGGGNSRITIDVEL